MSANERDWWEKRMAKEEELVKLWEWLTEDDYQKAGQTFDLLNFTYAMPDPDQQDDNTEYQERNDTLLRLMDKKENQQPVSCTSFT